MLIVPEPAYISEEERAINMQFVPESAFSYECDKTNIMLSLIESLNGF